MSQRRSITLLEYTLLGLMYQKPSSGYDLRKTFTTTALGSFSDSPGAIYPALRRLQVQGLVKSRAEAGGRRRRLFSLTEKGSAELKRWVTLPLAIKDAMKGLQEVMLRFAFSEAVAGAEASVKLLKGLEVQLSAVVDGLHQQMGMLKAMMPLSGVLALESGIRGYEAQLQWARYARNEFAGRKKISES